MSNANLVIYRILKNKAIICIKFELCLTRKTIIYVSFVSLLPKLLVVEYPFAEGGPFFMSLILICFLISLYFLVRGFLSAKSNQKRSEKMLKLVIDSSLLGLVIGFLASVIGLIGAFDSVEAMGDPDPAVFAEDLKVLLLTATFGLFTFVVSRLGILILR